MRERWTQARAALAIEVWTAGASMHEVGEAIGLTRSAVAGWIRRNGLTRKETGTVTLTPRRKPERMARRKRPLPEAFQITEKPIAARERWVPLVHTELDGCRFPGGDFPFVFCNAPQCPDASYCRVHRDVVRGATAKAEALA